MSGGETAHSTHEALLNALPQAIIALDWQGRITHANVAAEVFFGMGAALMQRTALTGLLPSGSPIPALIEQVRQRGAAVNEYRVDLGSPRLGDRLVDIQVAPIPDRAGGVAVMFQERTIAERMDRQLTHRGAARSVTALAAMLAHEIRNPLSGIRGAAQLLEQSVDEQDRELTCLICEETDRIVRLVDRMEIFSDERPPVRNPVNIHVVLAHVKRLAQSGFARHIRFVEEYDPSLPPVHADRDQLVQVVLNLVRNAAEAIGDEPGGMITLTTGYKPGVRMPMQGSASSVSLPIEVCVKDNGPGVPPHIVPCMFDPFVTGKISGTGLGLPLVAKILTDHGGIIECDSQIRRTVFRILLPQYTGEDQA